MAGALFAGSVLALDRNALGVRHQELSERLKDVEKALAVAESQVLDRRVESVAQPDEPKASCGDANAVVDAYQNRHDPGVRLAARPDGKSGVEERADAEPSSF